MEMVEFDREFVERTKWIIENTSCKYEITLLLNCMLALVALPTERTKSKGDADFQNRCVSKLKEMKVIEKESCLGAGQSRPAAGGVARSAVQAKEHGNRRVVAEEHGVYGLPAKRDLCEVFHRWGRTFYPGVSCGL